MRLSEPKKDRVGVGSFVTLAMLTTLLFTGCATQHARIGLPICDVPIRVSAEIWTDLEKLQETMSHNQLVDMECIELLRGRINLHDNNSL